jgi:2-dehydro-3-deoxygalactonokinase
LTRTNRLHLGTYMKHFLSCDWGTSSLRLRLAETGEGKILAETRWADGIAQTFERWQQSGLAENEKTGFYLDVINQRIKELEKQAAHPLKGLTLVLSGMAASSIGFIELPYTPMPFNVGGENMTTAFLTANRDFEHDMLIISGAKTRDDVMRGEETQLIGCIEPGRIAKNELFIFPGTHSKHIVVKDNEAAGLKTYMTGEVFSLLAQNSILKNSVEAGAFDTEAFKQGLADAADGSILNLIFKVRTNNLLDLRPKNENYHYLSGLLIGSEIKDLASAKAEAINLVSGAELQVPYQLALAELARDEKLSIFSARQADEATVKGQLIIAKQLKILT